MLRRTFAPLLRLVGLAAAAALVAACGLVAVRGTQTWTTGSTGVDGRDIVVNVVDRSGKVADIEFDPFDAAPGDDVAAPDRDVAMVPGQPDALDISWWGSACDTWTDLQIDGAGAGLAVKIAITTDNGDGCDASRKRIRLTLHQPVPPAMVAVSR